MSLLWPDLWKLQPKQQRQFLQDLPCHGLRKPILPPAYQRCVRQPLGHFARGFVNTGQVMAPANSAPEHTFFPAARVCDVGSAKQLIRPLQQLVVNMCGC